MRLSAGAAGLVGAVAGAAVAVAAYLSSSGVPAQMEDVSRAGHPAPDPTAPHVLTWYADCKPPAQLVRDTCVTYLERAVSVPRSPAARSVSGASEESHERVDD